MAKVLAKANVAYVDELLDALEHLDRKPFGEITYTVALDEDAHNQVYIVFTWASLPQARTFWQSDVARHHIEKWGSISKLELVFLRTLPTEEP